MKPHGRPVHRLFFNIAAPAVAIWTSGEIFFLVSGLEPYSIHPTPLQTLFAPLAIFTSLYFLLNSWLVAVALGFETSSSPVAIWWKNFTWLSVNYFSGASLAALIVTYTHEIDISTLVVIIPLLLISYLTFRTAMGRVDDANRHLLQLNKLYLSTIETLAMAIDAKDQITHGHIRRVQAYAVGLAKHVGVSDDRLIRAIEAAALLHDMGKLAVPEYILNKPGKLTSAEFEKMKLHASAGADILTAIDFPYPVVPIVRHHHENWDGSGYPSGLKGTDIPIGARILSVVDCFDALTSDRPYRPRLSYTDALRILLQRRGTMYDPLIVDTFVAIHEQITPDAESNSRASDTLSGVPAASYPRKSFSNSSTLDPTAPSADEMLTLYGLSGALSGHASISATSEVVAKHLRRLIPFSLCVLYLYDPELDELEATHTVGDAASAVRGLRIPNGQRLSGWVAANRQTIMNSDPILDLDEVARLPNGRLRSCLSSPLVADDNLIGVLTLYAESANSFTDAHKRIMEAVASQAAVTLRRANLDRPHENESLTDLPSLRQGQPTALCKDASNITFSKNRSLLFIDVISLARINDVHGRTVGDEALHYVADQVHALLQHSDVLVRYDNDGFVVLLNTTDGKVGAHLGRAIVNRLRERPLVLRNSTPLFVDVTVACATSPRDGRTLHDLIAAARLKLPSQLVSREFPSIH
jgi:diguanylate cyclase (GGDEF)-like protein/putative nucleotidyltransferase with HDIG domain